MSEHWQLFVALIGVVAAWSVVIIATQRWMLGKCVSDLEDKISNLSNIPKDVQELERSLMSLKVDLPLSYVRKEDFVRFDVVINTKLDRLRDLIEALQGQKK
jgi:hypothetical protein